jgi:glucosamine--fructose-6-phosphate aminotransferase (isomerizing)
MCGIVGYVGRAEAAPVLLDGLRRLEYRGYDSAGIAVVDRGHLGHGNVPDASRRSPA